MIIQDAIRACIVGRDLFGRPAAWKSTGTAIDLARRLDKTRIRQVVSLDSPHNLLGSDWNPAPGEFLGDWEVITAEELADETCQMEKSDV